VLGQQIGAGRQLALQPGEAEADMADLVLTHPLQQARRGEVSGCPRLTGEPEGEVEVGLLQGQTHAGGEGARRRALPQGVPEEARQGRALGGAAELVDALQVEAAVLLLFAQGEQERAPEHPRRLREAQKRQGHQLDRQELVVGEGEQQRRRLLRLSKTELDRLLRMTRKTPGLFPLRQLKIVAPQDSIILQTLRKEELVL
jgi:hypothetical protein